MIAEEIGLGLDGDANEIEVTGIATDAAEIGRATITQVDAQQAEPTAP